ncbi:MAG TPA: carboxylesterase family protein [Fimbriimonas sp.]|nr:carboxylesterase family protein [Fimbriimonas sp.]
MHGPIEVIPALTRRELIGAGAAVLLTGPSLLRMQTPGLTKSTLIVEPYVTVETANGKIRGGQSRGALAFKGIPYAGSVSGANRFKPAPPLQSWTGVKNCLSLGLPAPQAPNTVYGQNEPHPGEECLVLNVWTPAIDGKKRPVLFYNHGGGFRTGSAGSTAQDGGQLAANHDVVVVASNHRLGIMGYLNLEELGGEAFEGSGNAGMSDIVGALKWVHQNIEAFGGDPHNVTIFGESGGGAKTASLMAMPSAKGLFHKAGIMSGPMLRAGEKSHATEVARAVIAALGIRSDELLKLADVPLDQFLALQDGKGPDGKPVDLHGGFGPILDGKVVSQHPFDPAPAPYVADIPLLIGNNRDEATFFFWEQPDVFKMDQAAMEARVKGQYGKHGEEALVAFRKERPNANPIELYIAIETAGMWGESIEIAEAKATQKAPVYMYRYDYESNWPIKNTDWTLRAGHATEIQSKFENADLGGLMGTKPDRFQAAKNFGEVWTSFARTGHPHAPGVYHWPAYDTKTRATMLVDLECKVENDPYPSEREFMVDRLKSKD